MIFTTKILILVKLFCDMIGTIFNALSALVWRLIGALNNEPREIDRLSDKLDRLEKSLSAFVTVNGAIQVPDKDVK